MAHMRRASFSLPPDVLDQLDYVSRRLGASKSSVVAEVLGEVLGPLSGVLRALPDDSEALGGSDASAALLRFRGASGEVIRDRLNAARDAADAINPDAFELTPCEDRPAGCSCDFSSGERVAPRGGCLVHGEG